MKQVQYYVMEYPELEKLIEEKFGFEYESVAENEWNNDSCYSAHIQAKDMEDSFAQKYTLPEIEEAIAKKSGCRMRFGDLLDYLAWKGIVPEVHYLIEVCW